MSKFILLVLILTLQQSTCLTEVIKQNGHGSVKHWKESYKAVELRNKTEMSPPLVIHSVNGITFITSPLIVVFMFLPTEVRLSYSIDCPSVHDDFGVFFSMSVENVAFVSSVQPIFIRNVTEICHHNRSASGEISLTLTGILLGRTPLQIDVFPGLTPEQYNKTVDASQNNARRQTAVPLAYGDFSGHNLTRRVQNISDHTPGEIWIVCMKKMTKLDSILQNSMMVYLALVMFAMGCKTQVKVLKQVWSKPIAPAIGLFCQFVMMPMIAYLLTLVIPFPSPGMALGFFACGCAPGGGGSNLWSYLLGGDVSLSAAMTTISSIAAVGTFPMWIFTLGKVVLSGQSDLKIPYLNMIISLLMIAIPLTFGAIVNYKKPVFTKKMLRFLIPVVVILTILFMAASVYINFYMFQLVKPILFLSGALLPYIGYVGGLLLALLLRQSWTFCKTIAIETGIQNVGIAFILVMFSFPPPDNVIAATPALASASVTGLPLVVLAAIYHIYLRCCKRKPEPDTEGDEKVKTKNGSIPTEREPAIAKEKEAMLEEKVSSV